MLYSAMVSLWILASGTHKSSKNEKSFVKRGWRKSHYHSTTGFAVLPHFQGSSRAVRKTILMRKSIFFPNERVRQMAISKRFISCEVMHKQHCLQEWKSYYVRKPQISWERFTPDEIFFLLVRQTILWIPHQLSCHWSLSQGKTIKTGKREQTWRAGTATFPLEVKLYNTMNERLSR